MFRNYRVFILIPSFILLMVLGLGIVFAEGRKDRKMNNNSGMAVLPPGETEYVKPPQRELKRALNDLQYKVTQQDATEAPFQNLFWNNHEPGLYVDIVSGEPLFSSTHKYDSGTGWPSFYQPLEPGNVVSISDMSFGMIRTEVRSYYGDSHLGHVFNDGPEPTGLRYCINSASLRFIPVKDLEKEGYGDYLELFR